MVATKRGQERDLHHSSGKETGLSGGGQDEGVVDCVVFVWFLFFCKLKVKKQLKHRVFVCFCFGATEDAVSQTEPRLRHLICSCEDQWLLWATSRRGL